ncbi:MAG TPA: hypothetical protein VF755_15195 [Catenuloplanes sp.]
MSVFIYLHLVVTERLRDLRAPERRDRGDSPVPTAIIIAGLALLAAAVVVWAGTTARGFMARVPAP